MLYDIESTVLAKNAVTVFIVIRSRSKTLQAHFFILRSFALAIGSIIVYSLCMVFCPPCYSYGQDTITGYTKPLYSFVFIRCSVQIAWMESNYFYQRVILYHVGLLYCFISYFLAILQGRCPSGLNVVLPESKISFLKRTDKL